MAGWLLLAENRRQAVSYNTRSRFIPRRPMLINNKRRDDGVFVICSFWQPRDGRRPLL